MKISDTLNEELNQLLIDLNKVYNKKEELTSKLQQELGTNTIDLLAIDNNVYTIYMGFNEEKKDIKEIAESIGYELSMTYKKEKGFVYRLTTNPRC